ncbi:MAG: hypothetical protein HYZ50_20290 [Deltaproteobacteria bacterium]|nr:hypothetical protein [Deltaproteobacteria bacterium]
MIHHRRRFQVATVETQEEPIEQLTRCTWTLCTGFRFNGFLWLNDAFSEDGAQEYAVILEDKMTQVESVTVSWSTPEHLKETEEGLHTYAQERSPEGFPIWEPVQLTIETPDAHKRCRLCA